MRYVKVVNRSYFNNFIDFSNRTSEQLDVRMACKILLDQTNKNIPNNPTDLH